MMFRIKEKQSVAGKSVKNGECRDTRATINVHVVRSSWGPLVLEADDGEMGMFLGLKNNYKV
jgi:hypothetical protein